MQNKLPQFEANQVLSNEHLNQIILYLEEQSRLTRNYLLGSGIVSGLELRRTGTATLAVTEGVAVTSAGYLMLPQSDNLQRDAAGKGFIAYNKKRRFQPQFLLFPYTGDSNTTSNNYNLFNGLTDVWQLIETAIADNTDPGNVMMLTTADLDNRVAVLFLQIQVKELKSCEADSCMELGRQWTYSVLPLVMSKADADKLLQNENKFAPPPAANADMGPLTNPAYYLPDIFLQRPDFTGITADMSPGQLPAIHIQAIGLLINALIQPPYTTIDDTLKRLLKENFSLLPISDFVKKLVSFSASNAMQKPAWFQYVYDFVSDFIQAYSELQTALYEYASYEIPATDSFPHHVRLGMIPVVNGVLNSDMFPPQAYRHGFISSRILDKQKTAYENVVLLYKRLISLTQHLQITNTLSDLRITPGAGFSLPIASRAIPFYYIFDKKDEWNSFLTYWNPTGFRQGKTGRVLSYFDNYHTPDRTKFIKDGAENPGLHQPLLVQQPGRHFYRIEGHIGASYIDAFQIIQSYITQYNLPFDLQLVRLNKATVMLIKDKHILFSDLESLYYVTREEIRSLLTTELNYFSNIRLTKAGTKQAAQNRVAAQADTATAAPATKQATTADKTLFYRSSAISRQNLFTKTAGVTKLMDFRVAESVASISTQFAGQASIGDITTLLSGSALSIFQTKSTPAAAYITRIITAINNLVKVLSASFDDFLITDYDQALANLETETKNFVLFAKNLSDIVLKSDSNLVKGEVLDYLDRILYEIAFDQVGAIDDERIRRQQQVGVDSYLQQYVANHPGLEHLSGVEKGGTFVLVFDETGTVVADFGLPYRCCGGNGSTQYVLGILKTILLAGQVLDVNNAPVLKAAVTLNGETLPLDETAHFKKSVIPNSPLLLRIEADNFEPKQIVMTSGEDDIYQSIVLFTKAQEPKITLTLTVTGPDGKPLPAAIVMLGDTALKLDANGVFKGQVKANQQASVLSISLAGFKVYTDTAFTTEAVDKTVAVKLAKLITIGGSVVGPDQKPVLVTTVTLNGVQMRTTDSKFSFPNLDGDGSYNLVIEAENLEKYAETLKPGNADINRSFQLAKPVTFDVKVGIYVASQPVFEPPKKPTPFTPVRTLPNDRLMNVGGNSRLFKTAENTNLQATTNIRLQELLATRAAGTTVGVGDRGTISGSTYSLVDNKDASTAVDGVPQPYNSDLHLFTSSERKALHKLTVKVTSLRLSFSADLGISNNDVLVLIPARQGYTFQGMYSIIPTPDFEGANLKACNAFLTAKFGLPPAAVIMSRSFEIRFFTEEDAKSFASLMTTANIKYTTLSDR